PPFRRLGGTAGAQLEIPGVKQRAPIGFQKELCGTKDMSGGQKRDAKSANQGWDTEWKHTFAALSRQASLHETRGPFRDDDFIVGRDMIAVRMGDEGEGFCLPWIKPDILIRKVNSPLVLHRKHRQN